MKRKKSNPIYAECSYDCNPMRVSFAGGRGDEVCISINDDENDQSKQVVLSDHDAERIATAILVHLGSRTDDCEDALARVLMDSYEIASVGSERVNKRTHTAVARDERILRHALFGGAKPKRN
jgi:hypothetical protein